MGIVAIPPRPPEYVNFFNHFRSWPGSISGSDRCIAHIFIATRNTIKGVRGKRTNEQNSWVNSRCKKGVMQHCIPLCICRLMLAWISSEISTKLLGMPTYLDRSSITGLDPPSCRLVTSAVRHRLATRVTLRQLFLLSSFVELLLAFPCLLPITSRSWAKAFVWFRAKTDQGIVCLVKHRHNVTVFCIPQTSKITGTSSSHC